MGTAGVPCVVWTSQKGEEIGYKRDENHVLTGRMPSTLGWASEVEFTEVPFAMALGMEDDRIKRLHD